MLTLRRFIEYAKAHHDIWLAHRVDIARHWYEQHPAVRRIRPSEMDRATFEKTFGGVFEHSPWIVEDAFALELGQAQDSVAGLLNALPRIFRGAGDQERLKVLTAHPDLAGKLAAAKPLTAESTAEQAGAGLDQLTDEERTAFTGLNDSYVGKNGFPFIIAVRDHNKAVILEAFKRRLDHDRETEFAEGSRGCVWRRCCHE